MKIFDDTVRRIMRIVSFVGNIAITVYRFFKKKDYDKDEKDF